MSDNEFSKNFLNKKGLYGESIMRIISQNRMYSFDFDRTVFWVQFEKIYAKIGRESIAIGQYESDRRAAEVFEDMHNAYAPVGIITTNLTDEQTKEFIGSENIHLRVVKIDDPSAMISTYDSIIYYMPEV